jgi:hypothetical protein
MDAQFADLLDQAGCVAADTACRKCGYNVRGLPIDRNCPECNLPVNLSAVPNLLRYAEPRWARAQAMAIYHCSIAWECCLIAVTAAVISILCLFSGVYFFDSGWNQFGILITSISTVGALVSIPFFFWAVLRLWTASLRFVSHRQPVVAHKRPVPLWRSKLLIALIPIISAVVFCVTCAGLGIIAGLAAGVLIVPLLSLFLLPIAVAAPAAQVAELLSNLKQVRSIQHLSSLLGGIAVFELLICGAAIRSGLSNSVPLGALPVLAFTAICAFHLLVALMLLAAIRRLDRDAQNAALEAQARWNDALNTGPIFPERSSLPKSHASGS